MEPIKINQLEVENLKRIRAVKIEPTANGLTVLGGRNNQGKTSVLDAIAWALGGDRYRPSQPVREGSVIPPTLHIKLSNGLVVERKGKNSDLKVTDPSGQKDGQRLLNEFVEQLALDLPKFMQASSKEKAATLLRIIGVEQQLAALEREETETYNRRRAIGQIADQKKKFAQEQLYYPDAPKEPVSASELIRQQQDVLARNGENQRKRQHRDALAQRVEALHAEMARLQEELAQASADLHVAEKSAQDLRDESTAELEQNIADIETINRRVRANLDKGKAEEDALEHENQYNTLSAELECVRRAKVDLLQNTALPMPGLSVEEGELTYNGHRWDNMSGSAQLQVATAIVRRLNPKCGFVLLDKLEQMDLDTLREFGQWLEGEGLQVIATRVSTGDECSIIIEDGYAVESGELMAEGEGSGGSSKDWKEGVF
ncbi:MAG: AAA family ATPase [Clostridia bacterium]|nr:AAA family ATPase [Clostridia bacterium]